MQQLLCDNLDLDPGGKSSSIHMSCPDVRQRTSTVTPQAAVQSMVSHVDTIAWHQDGIAGQVEHKSSLSDSTTHGPMQHHRVVTSQGGYRLAG